MILRLVTLVVAVCLLAMPERASADMPMFAAREGIAIGGYDTVAYYQSGRAIAGNPRYSVLWKGAVWRFSTKSNQMRFEMNPRAFAPVFGGYCAYAMSRGIVMRGDPELWVILDGKLYLLSSPEVSDLWRADPLELIFDARDHWPRILRQ